MKIFTDAKKIFSFFHTFLTLFISRSFKALFAITMKLLSAAIILSSISSACAFAPVPVSHRAKTALDMGAVLYGSQGSRSPLVNWGASEIGVSIEMGDLSKNPHPFKQIPALTDDDDVLVFESGAILQYLYNKNAADKDSSKRSAAITSWILWANATLDPICFLETPDGKVYDTGLKNPNKRIDRLDQLLGEQEYLVEGGFSIADVAIASYLLYVPQFFQGIDLSRWPNVVAYMKRCAERDAYGKAFGSNVQQYLIASLDAMGGEKKKLFGMF